MPTLIIFEDDKAANFQPLTLTRPVFELRCGMSSLRRKIQRAFPDRTTVLWCREHLVSSLRRRGTGCLVNDLSWLDGDCVFVNGRALVHQPFALELGEAIVAGEHLVAARLDSKTAAKLASAGRLSGADIAGEAKSIRADEVPLLDYHWDLIAQLSDAIVADYATLSKFNRGGTIASGVYLYDGSVDAVFVGEGAKVLPGVVLDVSEGPIYIGPGAIIKPPSYIQGPTCIGEKSLIDGAKLREGCCIGPVCKIGGEVEASVFHARSNKHHEGFIGHAYIGEWVNCGALCTNSDLKNNYKPVRVQLAADQAAMNTGNTFVGSCIADHTKLGIGTLLNTGAVVGVGCNVFGGGVSPKYIPSFAWGGNAGFVEHKLEKMMETGSIVMKRRKMELDEVERAVLKHAFETTAADRARFLASKAWLKSAE